MPFLLLSIKVLYLGHKFIIRCVICKYFLPLYRWSSLHSVPYSMKFFVWESPIYLFSWFLPPIYFKKPQPNPRPWIFIPVPFSTYFIVSIVTFRSLMRFVNVWVEVHRLLWKIKGKGWGTGDLMNKAVSLKGNDFGISWGYMDSSGIACSYFFFSADIKPFISVVFL